MDEYLLAQIKRVAQVDHEILSSACESLRRMKEGVYSAEAAKEFTNFNRFITDRIVRHFAYEEEHLFPALLDDNPTEKTTQIIAELRQEHTQLLKRLRLWSERVEQRTTVNFTGYLRAGMMDFLSDLEKHAAKEEQLLESLA